MAIAGISWGVYSLAGRRAGNALQATAANFILAAPVGLLLFFSFPAPGGGMDNTGIALAVASGAVTSGLGYALWYSLLPQITATTAAIAQLTVPMLAIAGGAIVLSEALTLQFAFASLVVLAGVALSALPRRG
jgi:drug/metabolite transporter (DMT)-like permease